MEQNLNCYSCGTPSTLIGSCNHAICPTCLTKTMLLKHMYDLQDKEIIAVDCKCAKGKIDLPLGQILEIVQKAYRPPCKIHQTLTVFYCTKCAAWMCTVCAQIHKNKIFEGHQLSEMVPDLDEIKNCEIHKKGFKDLYCNQCEKPICFNCTLKGAAHFGHDYVTIEDLANDLREKIQKENESLEQFFARLNQMSSKAKDTLNNQKETFLAKIDEMIETIKTGNTKS